MIDFETAKKYLDRSWSVIPVILSLDDKGKVQKKPAIAWREYQQRLPTVDELHLWFDSGKYNGIGLITGKISQVVVVDVDTREFTFKSWMSSRTISGGTHAFYHWTEELRNDAGIDDKPIDFRGDGGFVVLPPSALGDQSYSWIRETETMYLDPLPDELKKLLKIRKEVPRVKTSSLNGFLPIATQGNRNDTATQVAGILINRIDKSILPSVGFAAFSEWNTTHCNPPLSDAELLTTWNSIYQTDKRNHPDTTHLVEEIGELTHLGNAMRLAKAYPQILRYNIISGKWMIWNDFIWEPDMTGGIFRLIHKQNENLKTYAHSLADKSLSKKLLTWTKACENMNNISSTERVARSIYPFNIQEKWDDTPYLFACRNGVVNLLTGELQNADCKDYITMQSQIVFDKNAEYSLWQKFIDECFDNDQKLIHYVQKALGYSLTGNNKEQVVFIGYGTGSNGKSTMLRILLKILGDYGHTAARTTFQANRFNDQTNDIAQLVGKRFVSWSETRMSASLDEEKLKAITGGENQRARMLYQDFFEFQPILKLWMFFNHKPIARDDSQGFWRRMRIIPFNHVFDGKDKDIDVKLSTELPGILNWLIEGCLMWQVEGLSDIPQAILEATGEYQEESDPLNQWLISFASIDDQKSIKASEAYKSYFNWAKNEGFSDKEILTSTMFGKRMTTKFKKVKDREGAFYIGLEIVKNA